MTENDLVTWPKVHRTVNVTFFFKIDQKWQHLDCYDKIEYDRKRLFICESNVNIYWLYFLIWGNQPANTCLQYCLLWKQGQYMFTVLWKVNICLQFVFGHTHTRRNVYSCNFRSNLKSKKSSRLQSLHSVIFIRSSWLASIRSSKSL